MNTSKTFVDRRRFLEGAAGVAVVAVCGGSFATASYDDDALLNDLSRRCFLYFWDATDPETGICRDLIHGDPADNVKKGDESRGSTGVTGFALTALCIGAERKWIAREQAKDRVRRALRSYTNDHCLEIRRRVRKRGHKRACGRLASGKVFVAF
jgi:hypothetical protein